MRIQHLPPERVPRSSVFKGSFILLLSSVVPNPFLFHPGQHYGPEVQKVVDTVDNDCFACRAAAARSPPR